MKENVRQASSGMGLLGWLFIVFLWLKLNPGGNYTTPIVDWSWWWVTAPLWGGLVLFLIGFFIAVISMGFLGLFGKK